MVELRISTKKANEFGIDSEHTLQVSYHNKANTNIESQTAKQSKGPTVTAWKTVRCQCSSIFIHVCTDRGKGHQAMRISWLCLVTLAAAEVVHEWTRQRGGPGDDKAEALKADPENLGVFLAANQTCIFPDVPSFCEKTSHQHVNMGRHRTCICIANISSC